MVFKEKGSLFSKMFCKPPPAKVKTRDPGRIPIRVVQIKVRSETSKNAGAMLTSQKGNKGTNLKNRR